MKRSVLVLTLFLAVAVKAHAAPQRIFTDCLVLKTRWDNYIKKSRLAEDARQKALDYGMTLIKRGKDANGWYTQDDPDCCSYPDKLIYWDRYYEEEEHKAYANVEKIYHVITERYLPYSSNDLNRMFQYRRAGGFESNYAGKKHKEWYDLPTNHPDRKAGVEWLFDQTYPQTEIHDFCKTVISTQ